MCTVVVLSRPGHAWPVMLAANRDEQQDRAWDAPAAHWPGLALIGGRDRTGGGTWMALNRHGVACCVLNRPGSLGPAPGKRSRGELPLIALAARSLGAAVEVATALPAHEWRSFNLVLASAEGAAFVRGLGHGHPEAHFLPPGISMVTAHDPNDAESTRVARHLPRFAAAPPPDADDWRGWRAVLADSGGGAAEQINVAPRGGFGTVCSALLGLRADAPPDFRFAPGPPDAAAFAPVPLAFPPF
ncbi:MAG: NRDE family protein [Proteobacteria bacterium]|nr:NRDE family protein [Pseudomonadota bacterium]